jgi:hypothetical protein
VLQHHLESELLAQSQDGEDVVAAVCVVVDDALAGKHLGERLQREVARRTL